MKIKRFLKKIFYLKNSLRIKIFVYILIPISLISILYFCTNQYYLTAMKQRTESRYIKAVSNISSDIDNSMYELFQNTSLLLSSSSELNFVFNSNSKLLNSDYYYVLLSSNHLSEYRAMKQIIDIVYIFHKADNLIISSNGTASANYFYKKMYAYKNYDTNFWFNLYLKANDYTTLNTSTVTNFTNDETSKIIPLVWFNSSNLLVVNIKESYIHDMLNQNKITENSNFYIFNNNGTILSQTDKNSKNSSKLSIEIANMKKKNINKLVTKFNGEKVLIINHPHTQNILGNITYVAVIPYNDLLEESRPIKTLQMLVLFTMLIFILVIAYIISNKIYNPIGKLTNLLIKNRDSSKEYSILNNELDFLNNEISSILNYNNGLKNDLHVAIPYVCEQFLFNILQDNYFYPEQEIRDFLSRYDFSFKYNYFAVIITNLKFSKTFFQKFSNEEQLFINKNLLKIIKIMFPEQVKIYTLSISKDDLCIIVNLPIENYGTEIKDSMQHFHDNLDIDNELLHIYSSIGGIHKDFSGLQKSYKEAMETSCLFSPNNSETIKVYKYRECTYKYTYSIDEENKLFNYLVIGDSVNVSKLINLIIDNNINNSISECDLKKLYIQLYNTGIRVLSVKNISQNEFMEENYIDIISNINSISLKELNKYAITFLNKLANYNLKSSKKIDLLEIKNYVNENYCNDIYLDQLAGKYNVSSKYMSKILKGALGISFHQYLSTLRITKAKELLVNTNKAINDIALEVGFNSRNTFIRAFKLLEGVTPSEYRNLSKSK